MVELKNWKDNFPKDNIYFETNNGILYKGDSKEILKKFKNKIINVVIIDPPYDFKKSGGIKDKNCKKNHFKEIYKNKLDESFDFEIIDILYKKLKHINFYIFCNKDLMKNLFNKIKYSIEVLIYYKKNPIPFFKNKYLSDVEYILFVRDNGVKVYGNYNTLSKIYVDSLNKNKFNHPTVKPLKLIENYILNSSKENEIVLDCFSGSGTTGVACDKLNRKWIMIETNINYCEISKNRIEKNINEKKLNDWF